jgi:hypothetical protein
MKTINKNLVTLGALVATSLLSTSTFAQSNSFDFSGRITRPTRPIVTRPFHPVKKKPYKFSVEGKEVTQQEEQKQHYLQLAVEYLQKNPNEISDYMDKRTFKVLAKLIMSGKKEELQRFDAPKVIYQRGGEKGKLLLQGDVTNLADLGQSLVDANNQKNLLGVYKRAYYLLSRSQRASFKDPKLLTKAKPKLLKLYLTNLGKILTDIRFVPVEPTSPGWKWDCDDEIGQQYNGTGDNARRCQKSDFHPDSLWKNSTSAQFPLKYYHTCIKSQGSRGTCVSFAINAAVESALMVKENKSYNLAEQYTYFYGEIYSNHSGRYSYGLNTGSAVKKMDSKNIKFQYEKWWEYNPSSDIEDKSGDKYPDSCVGYPGEMCTEYAFQAQESITGFWPFKNYHYTVPYRGTSKNIQIVDTSNIWMSWNKNLSLDLAINLTMAKQPLVVSFNVKQNFMDVGSDGYVYHESNQDQRGGHASVILGFVPNNKLPAGVTPADEKGFFIVKNSWGTWNGDCGYYYVDYKYFRKYAKGIFTVAIN